jgi:hypothetical protein
MPKDFLDRVRAERAALADRNAALIDFILNNPAWADVAHEEKNRMRRQYVLQCELIALLDARIKSFQG